ncbi:MAG: hypothetical protein IPM91_04030 [Bacteroidetes bacterium]|nr:hypothetical protein [Bacteroidota bacterium]
MSMNGLGSTLFSAMIFTFPPCSMTNNLLLPSAGLTNPMGEVNPRAISVMRSRSGVCADEEEKISSRRKRMGFMVME